jgi:magnesium-transporting ATPase (P-type)
MGSAGSACASIASQMPFDPAHFVERFFSPFNPESRFYWPAVYSLLLALVVNIVWYNWRRRAVTPPENAAKPWAFWINVVFIILFAVLLVAKVPFYFYAVLITVNVALVFYMYEFLLPPQEAAYEREQRRRQYFPQPKKKRRR